MNEIIKKKTETGKKRYKTRDAGWSIPKNLLFSPPLLFPCCYPEGIQRALQSFLGQSEPVGSFSGSLVADCPSLRISNSTARECGFNQKGRPTSESILPSKFSTYVYLKGFHFDGAALD